MSGSGVFRGILGGKRHERAHRHRAEQSRAEQSRAAGPGRTSLTARVALLLLPFGAVAATPIPNKLRKRSPRPRGANRVFEQWQQRDDFRAEWRPSTRLRIPRAVRDNLRPARQMQRRCCYDRRKDIYLLYQRVTDAGLDARDRHHKRKPGGVLRQSARYRVSLLFIEFDKRMVQAHVPRN